MIYRESCMESSSAAAKVLTESGGPAAEEPRWQGKGKDLPL
jgi:hypothetical protein